MAANGRTLTMPSNFAELEDMELTKDPKSILIYGDSGKGKTFLAASIAQVKGMERVLYIDVDGGSTGATSRDDDGTGIDQAVFNSFANVKVLRIDLTAAGEIERLEAQIAELLHPDFYFYDAVIIDGCDGLQGAFEVRNRLSMTAAAAAIGKAVNGFDVWGNLAIETESFFRALHNNPNFVSIFITHAADPKEGKFVITPNFVGASKDKVVSIPDIVMYMETVDEGGVATRVAHLGNSSFLVTKNRVGIPPKF